ncbi:MAG: hypothetical protein J5830_04725, partial [Clostridia bacterium]|nr:hypothetical protein [Clostridia bacterium]
CLTKKINMSKIKSTSYAGFAVIALNMTSCRRRMNYESTVFKDTKRKTDLYNVTIFDTSALIAKWGD